VNVAVVVFESDEATFSVFQFNPSSSLKREAQYLMESLLKVVWP
jgi:hypothetical protein